MRNFFNQKRGMIGKLFIYQIAMSLFGLFVISPFMSSGGSLQILAAIFSTLFYFALVCYAVIEDGQKDFVSHTAQRLSGKPYTGLLYSLISYIPTMTIVILSVVLSFIVEPGYPSFISTVLGFLNILIRFFLMGMFLGFDTGLVVRDVDKTQNTPVVVSGHEFEFLSNHYLIFAICLILVPLVCGTTYYLAFKGKIHVDTTVKEKKKKKLFDKKEDEE